jgi:Coenzyme PQQ synthesis protein D (PqqD)
MHAPQYSTRGPRPAREAENLEAETRLQRSPEATFQVVADEAILIHLYTGVYYSLNDVGTTFWNLLDGQRTIGECADEIAAEYDAPRDVVLGDLIELAGDLAAEGLATT